MYKIILYLPRIMPGGIYESNRLLAKGFSKKNYEVIIVANRKTDLEIEGFKHYYLEAGDILRPLKLKNIILNEKPIAVFSNMLPQNITLSIVKLMIGKKLDTKYFGFVRNPTSNIVFSKFYQYPYKLMLKKLLDNLDKSIAVSTVVKEDLKKAFNLKEEKIAVVYNPLCMEEIEQNMNQPLSKEEESIFKNRTILYVGRFENQKRIYLLINIFNQVVKYFPDINLVLVGNGSLKEKLIKQIENLKLSKKVHLIPFTQNPYKYMKNANLFISTSQDEGFGRVIAESLACSTPVLAYENEFSGHKDIIINGKNGYLIPFGREDLMIKKIVEILNNPEEYTYLKQNTHNSIKRFYLDNIINQLENLFIS